MTAQYEMSDHQAHLAQGQSDKSESQADHFWNLRCNLLYRIELSILYHREREWFLDVCDKVGKAASVLGGTAVFATVTGADIRQWAGLAIAVVGVASMVFGIAEKARKHADLASRYGALESEIFDRGDYDYSEIDINKWRAKFAQIESQETSQLSNLVKHCQNRISARRGETISDSDRVGALGRLSMFII